MVMTFFDRKKFPTFFNENPYWKFWFFENIFFSNFLFFKNIFFDEKKVEEKNWNMVSM